MAKKASKKKKSTSKKKQSGNIFTKILIIIFVVVFVGFIAFKYFPKNNSNKNQKTETQLVKEENKQTPKDSVIKPEKKPVTRPIEKSAVAKSIEGCWMSTTGGAVLTMKDFEYRIDFMGVDSGKPIIGTYFVENDIVTFSNKQDPCKDTAGAYEVNFDKHEISFKCKNDDCTKRKSTLVTDWEWLEE
ncbi:MAG: hypothetical protein MJZ47_03405 [Bacteroidales bacterium]|nr:hypothetical protein [Bacteroidales bacterium]